MNVTIKRHKYLSDKNLMRPPYPWVANVDVSAANWQPPHNVRVCELRVESSGNLHIRLRRGSVATVPVDDFDILAVDMDATGMIYTGGTTATGITAFGVFVDEMDDSQGW